MQQRVFDIFRRTSQRANAITRLPVALEVNCDGSKPLGSAVHIVDPPDQLGGFDGLDVQIEDEASLPASR